MKDPSRQINFDLLSAHTKKPRRMQFRNQKTQISVDIYGVPRQRCNQLLDHLSSLPSKTALELLTRNVYQEQLVFQSKHFKQMSCACRYFLTLTFSITIVEVLTLTIVKQRLLDRSKLGHPVSILEMMPILSLQELPNMNSKKKHISSMKRLDRPNQ